MRLDPPPPSLELLRHIIVDASRARNQAQQVDCIVKHVQQIFSVPVCSLYLIDSERHELRLIATLGLNQRSVDNLKLAFGEGLIGTIAESQLPLLLDRASSHPDYLYFPETGEAKFEAFLGVPIIHLGDTLGVLVVQDSPPRQFDDEDEAFLITISAQLASSLLRWPSSQATDLSEALPRQIKGIKGAPGVAIGHIHFVSVELHHFSVDNTVQVDSQQELTEFQSAVTKTIVDLDAARKRLRYSVSEDVLEVFDFYKLMLGSEQLTKKTELRISEGETAINALRSTVDECALIFESMDDIYFRAKGEDVRNIGNRLFKALLQVSQGQVTDASNIVLIGDLVSVADIGQFEPGQLAAIVCMNGSALSHTALLASALGIPAVMGTGDISGLKEGDTIAVDGYQGRLIANPGDAVLKAFNELIKQQQQQDRLYLQFRDQPAETVDGYRIRLLANTGLLADISPGLERGAEGIGLYRTEIPFMARDNFPSEEEQLEIYLHLLSAYHPHPVSMRTLDIGGDKPLPYFSFREDNPALGWRGIRFTLDNRPVFISQLRAMLRANASLHNLRVLLPMVSRVDEVLDTLELINTAAEQLSKEGLSFHRPQLGIMVEVPAAIMLLPFIAPHIDFISIGSNDLSQYILAVDRNNPRVCSRFDLLHPAVLHTIVALVQQAKELHLNISLCGEMASDPLAVMLLIGMGIEVLSMNSCSLPKIKYLIRHIHRRDAEQWLNLALKLDHETKIRELLTLNLEKLQLHDLLDPPEGQQEQGIQ